MDDDSKPAPDANLQEPDDLALNTWLGKLDTCLGFSTHLHAIHHSLGSAYARNNDDG